jgi:hypothetical protein
VTGFIGNRIRRAGGRVRGVALLVAAVGLAGLGLGYCSDRFGLRQSDEGGGVDSAITFPASELETTLAVVAVHNTIELRVTHDIEVFGRTQDLYTDVYPAEVPGFVELRIDDLPDIDIDGGVVTVSVDRGEVYVQERVEQLGEPVAFTVHDGRIVEGQGLPVDAGTRVFLEDGSYSTGAFSFDPEAAESVLTKIADGVTLGLTDISAGTSENILKIAQLATLNPACLQAVDETVGLDSLLAAGIVDHFVEEGYAAADVDVVFTGEYPAYDAFPDETGTTFAEARQAVAEALRGDNKKTIDLAADCDADDVVEPASSLSITPARVPRSG